METKVSKSRVGWAKTLLATTVFALAGMLLGCFGATPLPRRTRTAAGMEVKNIDLTFIRPGQTTRVEVQQKLKVIDAGYQGNQFFLGRWSSSSWGTWVVVAGYTNSYVGGGRLWKSGNVLVEFDDAGLVKTSKPFDDSHAIRELNPVAERTPLPIAIPTQLAVKYWKNGVAPPIPATITLSASSFDFEELGEAKKKHKFSLPAKDVLRLETPVTIRDPDPTYLVQRLRCSQNLKRIGGPSSKDLNLEMTLPQLVTLLSYVSQAAKSQPDGAARSVDQP